MKAKVTFDNSHILEKGGYVNPTSTINYSGPGWYAMSSAAGEWVRVSSKGKEEGFTAEEADLDDYVGSPSYLDSFASLERWFY